MFKFVRRLLLALIALIVVLLLARNAIVGSILKGGIQRLTGFQTHIGALNLRLTRPEIAARDIAVRNPPDAFRERRAMEINRIEAVYQPGALMRRKLHCPKLVLDISQVLVVKNASGETNLKRLQPKINPSGRDSSGGGSSNFQIDELIVSINEALYIDEKKEDAQPRIFRLNVKNRVYRNIKSSQDIKKIVTNLVIEKLPSNLISLTPQALDEGIESVNKGMNTVTNLLEKGKNILDIFGESGKDRQPTR